jgi:hypothetical protein
MPAQAASQKSLSRKWLSNLFPFASGVYILASAKVTVGVQAGKKGEHGNIDCI